MDHDLGLDLEKDIVYLSEEVRRLRNERDRELKRNIELSYALNDMFFAFTCFEEHGIEQYPEDMQNNLREMRQKAAEAYVGKKLPPIPNPKNGIKIDLEFLKDYKSE